MRKSLIISMCLLLLAVPLLTVETEKDGVYEEPTRVQVEANYIFDFLGRNYTYWSSQPFWVLSLTIRNPYDKTTEVNITVSLVTTINELNGISIQPYSEINLAFTLCVDMLEPSLTPHKIWAKVSVPTETFTWAMDFYIRYAGDVDGNGWVDWEDYGLLYLAYGKHYPDPDYNTDADFNADGKVSWEDLAILSYFYGSGIS